MKIEIPLYEELSVRSLFPKLKDQLLLKGYLPDWNANTYHEKQFFYPLISTLFLNEISALVKEARKKRWVQEYINEEELVAVIVLACTPPPVGGWGTCLKYLHLPQPHLN